MSRLLTWPALALLGALLCLAACDPTGTVSVAPTATTSPVPTATPARMLTPTPTPVLASTPTNVPTGWQVLATTHFSIAYPPGWTVNTLAVDQAYTIWAPAKQGAVQVTVVPQADVPRAEMTLYCLPESSGARHTTLANLPMTLEFTGLSNSVRVWRFVNTQQTLYLLSAGDVLANAATQAQDTAILATFRPDNATPWNC